MLLGAFSERRLAQVLGESNEAKFRADAFPAVRHFGGGLGLQRGFLKFAHVCDPIIQGMLLSTRI